MPGTHLLPDGPESGRVFYIIRRKAQGSGSVLLVHADEQRAVPGLPQEEGICEQLELVSFCTCCLGTQADAGAGCSAPSG